MIRVLNVVYDERFGGPQFRILQVASALRIRDIETVAVAPEGDAIFKTKLGEAGIDLEEFDLVRMRFSANPLKHSHYALKFWSNVWTIRKLIRRHGTQIVHTNGLMNVQAAIAARLERVRLVWHLNDVNTPWTLRRAILPLVTFWADRIAAASRGVNEYYFGSAPPNNVHVLYPPVDISRFHPGVDGTSVRRELGISRDCPIIGTVANLCPGKGFEFLLDAASEIKRRFPETKFILVGAPLANRVAYRERLLDQVRRLNLDDSVIFLGRRDDVPQVLAAMTVYVHASEAEAAPMSVLEACAIGLPVVATDVGGTRDFIEHGKTGLLVPTKSPSSIVAAVGRLLESPDEARNMGVAGTRRIRERFSLEHCVEEHLRIYSAALNGRQH